MIKNKKRQRGFGLVEIIVCITIIVLISVSFLSLVRYNLIAQEQARANAEAINLAIEAMEAVTMIRAEDWTNISSLNLGTNYYPIISVGSWTLDSVNPGLINQNYNRWVVLERVYRDDQDNIAASGTEDSETRKIVVFVEWTNRGQTKSFSLESYLTNWSN